jgi:hypothetical protein
MHDSIRFHSSIKGNIRLCEFYSVVKVSKSLIKICLENYVCFLLTFSISSSTYLTPFFITRAIPRIFCNGKNHIFYKLGSSNTEQQVWNVPNISKPYKNLCQDVSHINVYYYVSSVKTIAVVKE